ncbi:DUF6499 domain-containing protein [Mesorhizobium sp. VK25A]|uniref:DUF6499 domain-containing protein n=1 Tax=Mesorhizobium vachelliae TaxID=3072309 RepID=A0ABU5ADJ8_9HYPH|nr:MULTISPECIES: DUF6499 domain-containing protein [unclassified Mesorhizobium]MDX8535360.1 DUF6499 domain-containing protein [Mesorhizobium sp. VK25D]MDX8546860.1 DUF6499 domain-containing protein [Mesorhizobium sp. VK25A]
MSLPEPEADRPDWRDERSYDYTLELTRRGWAWEFLRRNPAFRDDLSHALERARSVDQRPSLDVILSSADLSRWGLLFRVLDAP